MFCRYCHIWSLWSRNGHHHWIHIKKLLQNIYNTYVFAGIAIYGHSDHEMDIIIEFTSKNCSRTYITLICICWYCHICSFQSRNGHHHWIHIKKSLQNIYNTYVFAGIAIYDHSNHKTDITIEFASKNHSRTYKTWPMSIESKSHYPNQPEVTYMVHLGGW